MEDGFFAFRGWTNEEMGKLGRRRNVSRTKTEM